MDEKIKSLVDGLSEKQLIEAIGTTMVGKRKEILGKVMKLVSEFDTDSIAQEIADSIIGSLNLTAIKNDVMGSLDALPDMMGSSVDSDMELSAVVAEEEDKD